MKRNHALVTFDQERIVHALRRAADSVGGFERDYLDGINDRIFSAGGTTDGIAGFLSDLIVICLNSDPKHLVSNFPPTIEEIQDTALHVLRSYGFTVTADAYACFRWGHHWVREGAISEGQFIQNGYPEEHMEPFLSWNKEHDCDTVAGLNSIITSSRIGQLIGAAISHYEATVEEAAARVMGRIHAGDEIRMILISGPSSSGKTTTTLKLTDRLSGHGLRFRMLNLDDYFWPLIEHPTDWINDRNYETPEALHIQLLNSHLKQLLAGKKIEKPVYSFKEGRQMGTIPLRIEPDQILVLDCLHGFFPPITEGIDDHAIFRLYIEAMNPLYQGSGPDRRPTRFEDIRLLRRMLRDAKHRNHPPLSTLLHWYYVRAGELFGIIPLKGLADVVLNGGMPFDLPALKPFFEGKDSLWPRESDLAQYSSFLDARIRHRRVSKLLGAVQGLTKTQVEDQTLIPGDALIREFIGGSTIAIPHNVGTGP